MSWKDAIQYAKAVAGNHGIESVRKEDRVDDGLPFGARIGGVLTLQMSPFIRAAANGSLITCPTVVDTLIKAVGRVRLNLNGTVHRLYLSLGDDDIEQERFLQVFTNEHGEIAETLYCTRLTRIIPQTDEDQAAFTGATGVGLGEKNYSLWKEQLAGLGIDASTLQVVFGDADSIEYTRDAGDADTDFMVPFTGSETRVDDVAGQRGLEQQIYFMPYVRSLGSDGASREYLLITTEIVESQDGDASKRAIHVDFMIGIPIEKERITIQ
jgi:hypothetical protein